MEQKLNQKDKNDSDITLDHNSFEPLYHQLKVRIKEKIESGIWAPGTLIPSEKFLVDTYKVSRPTIRQALQDLVREGLIYRERGKGSFVAQPKMNQIIEDVYGFTQSMLSQGFIPTSIVLKQKLITPSSKVATFLNVPSSEKVIFVERIRIANSMRVMLDRAYFAYRLCPGLESMDLSESIYKILKENFNYILSKARESLELSAADKYIARYLDISEKTPIFFKERMTFTSDNIPIEYSNQFIRGDKCRFVVELTHKVIDIQFK
ncbi:MAG: GntR family transcriptional regulator [Actinobacteria bacterium]|nr:GntR family transcriptional regulator [Actinomycetota bacterium]